MLTINKHALLIIIERDGVPHEAWTVVPAPDRVHLVAVNESGETVPFGWVVNDCTIGTERLRIVEMLPDKEFIAVPWTPDMGERP